MSAIAENIQLRRPGRLSNFAGRAYTWATKVDPGTNFRSHAVSATILKAFYYLLTLTVAVVSCRYLSYFRALNLEDLVATGVVSILSGLSAYGVKNTFFYIGKAETNSRLAQSTSTLRLELEARIEELDAAQQEVEAASERNFALGREIAVLKSQVAALTADHESKLSLALRRLAANKKELEKKEPELAGLRSERTRSSSDPQRLIQIERRIDSLTQDIIARRMEIRDAECEIIEEGTLTRICEIGAGGMSKIILVRCEELGIEIALKQIKADRKEYEGYIGKEALIISRINHPNIIRVFGLRDFEGSPVIAMEFFNGSSLEAQFGNSVFTIGYTRQNIGLMRAFAEAVQELHSKGIIHRDLKPGNALVDGQTLKVIDFGLAKHKDSRQDLALLDSSATMAGTIKGTPTYIAPETFRTCSYDTSSDVYSLGLIFMEILTGNNPFFLRQIETVFKAEDMMEATDSLNFGFLGSEPHYLRFVKMKETFTPTGLPDTGPAQILLKDLLSRMLAVSPSARPSAKEVVAVLLRAAEMPLEEAHTASASMGNEPTIDPIDSNPSGEKGGEK